MEKPPSGKPCRNQSAIDLLRPLNLKDAARALRLSAHSVRQLVREGKLKVVTRRRRRFFLQDHIREYLANEARTATGTKDAGIRIYVENGVSYLEAYGQRRRVAKLSERPDHSGRYFASHRDRRGKPQHERFSHDRKDSEAQYHDWVIARYLPFLNRKASNAGAARKRKKVRTAVNPDSLIDLRI